VVSRETWRCSFKTLKRYGKRLKESRRYSTPDGRVSGGCRVETALNLGLKLRSHYTLRVPSRFLNFDFDPVCPCTPKATPNEALAINGGVLPSAQGHLKRLAEWERKRIYASLYTVYSLIQPAPSSLQKTPNPACYVSAHVQTRLCFPLHRNVSLTLSDRIAMLTLSSCSACTCHTSSSLHGRHHLGHHCRVHHHRVHHR
jgi:hypothetical protein